jgi:hypothetical protein
VFLLVAFFVQLWAIELQGQPTGLALFTSITAKVCFALALVLWALTPAVLS